MHMAGDGSECAQSPRHSIHTSQHVSTGEEMVSRAGAYQHWSGAAPLCQGRDSRLGLLPMRSFGHRRAKGQMGGHGVMIAAHHPSALVIA